MNAGSRKTAFLAIATLAGAMCAALSGGASAAPREAVTTPATASRLLHPVSHVPHHAKHRYVARHGVYYPPRIVVYSPRVIDFSDDDHDDRGEDEFDLADLNNDGFISLREARRTHSDWARDFRKIDTSGDGYLTREEVDAFYGVPPAVE